tara:strand:- start:1152 stop:1757 length:606 start_codon:yes stop_codon:yes gene_type:complete
MDIGILMENMDNFSVPKSKEPIFENWYIVRQFLQLNDIGYYKESMEGIDWQEGSTVGETEDYRNSMVKWTPKYQADKFKWLYERIWNWTNIANDELWNFDLIGFKDAPQYTRYEAPSGKYDWHMDIMGNGINHRKVSFVCELSHRFEGGKLQFKTGTGHTELDLGYGDAVFFPSFYLHRVTPITEGRRESLVQWISGKPYK